MLSEVAGIVFRTSVAVSAIAVAIGGCATQVPSEDQPGLDPLESMNRGVFRTYLVLDDHALRPVAQAYRAAIPTPVRESIRNAIDNLDSPGIFINDTLRGRAGPAGSTFLRVVINSTLGIGGLFDVASGLGLERHSDDFGKTMAAYGIGEGPYLFFILIGPTNLRDLTGSIVDLVFSPFALLHDNATYFAISGDLTAKVIDRRERNLEVLDDLRSSSVDFYAAVRDAYTQSRRHELDQELGVEEPLPEF